MGSPKLSLVPVCQPPHRISTSQAGRWNLFHVSAIEVIFNFHHVFGGRNPTVVVIIEIGWGRKFDVLEQFVVHRIGTPITVRRLELIKQHEWFVCIPFLRKPFNAIVFNDFGRVPRFLHQGVHAVDTELRVEIRSLTSPIDQHLGIIKSRWCCSEVPLPNDCRFIPILLKHLGKSQQLPIEITPVHIFVKSIDVTELPRQN